MTTRRLGVLGGTFDPIHCGHVDAAMAADAALGFTELIVVPSFIPPHRSQPCASGYHRFAMVALAVAGRTGWRASDLELQQATASYTAATLARLHADGYRAHEIFFIVGADAFAEIETWRNYPSILDDAHFAVVSRPGWPVGALRARLPALATRMREGAARDVGTSQASEPARETASPATMIFLIDAPTADVSSTAIRERIAARQPIAGMVPALVQQHIEQHGLYTQGTPARAASAARHDPAAGRLHGED